MSASLTPSQQVTVQLLDKKLEETLPIHTEDKSTTTLADLIEALKQRQERRKNGEDEVAPILSSYSQIRLSLASNKATATEVSDELAKRRKYLHIRQEERAYNQMMYGDSKNPHTEEVLSKSNQFSSFRNQLSMGVNVLFSLFAAFGMLYYVARHVMGFDDTKSLIVGLFSAIVVLLVEMSLFILRAVRIEDETEKQASIRAEVVAQQRSGGLVTAHFQKQPNPTPPAPTNGELQKLD